MRGIADEGAPVIQIYGKAGLLSVALCCRYAGALTRKASNVCKYVIAQKCIYGKASLERAGGLLGASRLGKEVTSVGLMPWPRQACHDLQTCLRLVDAGKAQNGGFSY
jgi:hypothetical protein